MVFSITQKNKSKPHVAMVVWLWLAVWVSACHGSAFDDTQSSGNFSRDSDENDSDTATGVDAQLGIGRPCQTSEDCFTGILCSSLNQTCQYPTTPGTYVQGAECDATLFCGIGLVCAAGGTCETPGSPGTGKIGDGCTDISDCEKNYICSDAGKCDGYEVVYWEGASCTEPSEEGDFVAYFDISRESGEYYRLPFPNDGAVIDGHIDMEGHTDPGELNPELGNITGTYLEYMQSEMDGFGTQSNIYFRMSHKPNWDTVSTDSTVYIVNIDPASSEYGEMHSTSYRANTAAGMYICANWIALRPSSGKPLAPGTTYAAILKTGIRDLSGNSLTQDAAFANMLKNTAPTESRAANGWRAYAPLREYLSSEGVDASQIAVAAVFTTQRFDVLPSLRAQVRSEAMPVLVDDQLEVSANNSAYTQYSGVVTVPFYQNGVRPFAVSGGQFQFDSNGNPIWVEDDQVPFAATIPKGEMPEMGWPVFLYAHGTDGSETSFIDDGTAKRMAEIGVAVISMLQVQHGERRGIPTGLETEETQPGMLFYNFRNPHAAIGNNYQAAADYFQLVRLVENFSVVTGADVVFNVDKLYYFGHSQGTQGQYIAAVHEPLIKGLVLSGAGGYLTESILNKKEPFDMSIAIQYLLMDPKVDSAHPVLSLVQTAMEQVDPVNHRRAAFKNEWTGMEYPARDVFMSYGINDSYAPESTQSALSRSLSLYQVALDDEHSVGGLTDIESFPHSESRSVDGTKITTVMVQYAPDGDYDGHFVLFQNADAISQMTHFVETMVADDTPAELIAP